MFDVLDTITKDVIYKKLADLLTAEEFEREIKHLREKHHGLLNDDALAFILLDSHGRNDFQKNALAEMKDGDYVTMVVEVTAVPGVRTIRGRDGKEKELAEVKISDESATCTLTLWSTETIELVKEEAIKKGMKMRVINGRFKRSRFGEQINMGYWSKLEVL